MKTIVVRNRIIESMFAGDMDCEVLTAPSEFRGMNLYGYLRNLHALRPDLQNGSTIIRALKQVEQSCWKYQRKGVCPILSEPIAWFIQAEFFGGDDPGFIAEGLEVTA